MDGRVSILLPQAGLYPRLGIMLVDAFRELGWQAAVSHDAQLSVLDADLLLLVGMCRHIDGLPKLLQRRQGRSPATILWQLEPLPPEQLSAHGEEIGTRVAACDWARRPRLIRRMLGNVIPFRTQLIRAFRRWRARAYTHEALSAKDHQGWLEYDVENYFNAVAEWEWIKAAHAQGWLDHCFASNQARVRFLRSRSVAAEMIPFGYHPHWGRDRQIARDVDVLFLGTLGHGPRHAKLRWVQQELQRRGRSLTFVKGVFGAAREEWLSRTKIMLNLLRFPHDLAGMRVLIGMAGGALVVSEACADAGAFVPGKHFVAVPVKDVPVTIEHYLDHEPERSAIASEGHRFVTEELTLSKVLRKMLKIAAVTSAP